MAKVDWITWKTDSKEIIKPEQLIEKIKNSFQDYNCYMNSVVYEGINHELQRGGLSKESLNVLGLTPANTQATAIIERIDKIKQTIEEIKQSTYNDLLKQKEIEKEQLINSIEDKIKEEEKILENTTSLKERLTANQNIISNEQVEDIITTTNERINKLKERLELAKSL